MIKFSLQINTKSDSGDMNVCIFTSWYPHAKNPLYGSFVRDQALALHQTDCNVSVCAISKSGLPKWKPKVIQHNDPFPCSHIDIGFLPLRNHYTLKLFVSKFRALFQKHVAQNPDVEVIHAHNYLSGYAALFIGKEMGIPVVITEHASTFLTENVPSFHKEIIPFTFDSCDALLCVSELLKNKVKAYSQKEVQVVPNPIDPTLFYFQPTEIKNTFISVADLDSNKGFDLLIESMTQMPETCNLLVFGEGVERSKIETLLADWNLSDRVTLAGIVTKEKLADALRQSKIFVLASEYETFGIVYIEAMACGLPVIGTNAIKAHGFANDQNAILIDERNTEQLVKAMKSMLDKDQIYNRKKISEDILANYSNQNISQQLISIYQSILG